MKPLAVIEILITPRVTLRRTEFGGFQLVQTYTSGPPNVVHLTGWRELIDLQRACGEMMLRDKADR